MTAPWWIQDGLIFMAALCFGYLITKSMMARARAADPPTSLPAPSIAPGVCPGCGAMEHTKIVTLFMWRQTEWGVRFEECGARLSCQRCPTIYSVGPRGWFTHHARSLPFSPQIPDPNEPQRQAVQDSRRPVREPDPIPKERPPV